MDTEQRQRIDTLIGFHADLKRYAERVGQYEDVYRAWARATYRTGREPLMDDELEDLRQDLLRRSGAVRPLFQRLAGRLIQPGPFHSGQHDAWDLALVGHRDFYRASYARQIADILLTVIGRLEDDPALLEPPPPPPAQPVSALQPINVYGGTVNIAQTASGDISQTIAPQQGLAEVRELLNNLESAIRDLGAPEEDIIGYLEPVEQLDRELGKSRPLISRLTTSWGAIAGIAAVEGTWQGWDRVQRIAADIGPKLHDLIEAMARTSGHA